MYRCNIKIVNEFDNVNKDYVDNFKSKKEIEKFICNSYGEIYKYKNKMVGRKFDGYIVVSYGSSLSYWDKLKKF